ncbi:MAG TPA: serine hydrolase, partial [Thermoanaerobaculia bacterium]
MERDRPSPLAVSTALGFALILATSLVSCVSAPPRGLVHRAEDGSLAGEVSRIAAKTGARLGIVALHVESGRKLAWNENESFEAASVIKVAMLVEAASRIEEGTLDPVDRWRLASSQIAAGSGILGLFQSGLEPTNADLLRLMIDSSDNTAANRFIDLFGQDAVNRRMETLGLPGIRLLGRIPDRDPKETEDERWAGLKLGSVTPGALAEYYRKAATGTLGDRETSRFVLEILRGQRNVDRIPRQLLEPKENRWAGKTGLLRGVRNDSGILTTKKGRFVLVVLADRIPEKDGAGPAVNRAMGEIAKAIVDAWSVDLPDIPPAPDEKPVRRLAPELPRVEVSPLEARPGVPPLDRVYRPLDEKFWELWKRSGGDLSGACLIPMPNSWWEENDPWKIEPISALILHHTAQETDGECIELFLKPASMVSSHFLVGSEGRLWQFVSLEHRAWHAGTSLLHGRRALNRTSIGVEITGNGNHHPFTRAQVETTVRLVGVLTALFDLKAP